MSRSKVGLLVAAGVGIAGGKYLFEPPILEQKQKAEQKAQHEAINISSPPKIEEAPPQQQPAPSTATLEQPQTFFEVSQTLSSIANTRTLACLPSTEISKSAHPNDAAKIMDHPLPSSPLTAKKIPSKEDSGEMQAEPYTIQSPGGVGLFGKVRFW
ncbi:uncharacterized protein DFL_006643 [Arthrobotrys flagrans]|uniref:Uncharacterized protein n=1 Tax=Arthrobotrys flagrans TaxID=97331 RepID=A0A436ZTH6_ARTFL|nr:hypothetical protein DFL_006643 [Arthrobotrys flagrans]